MNGNGKDNMHGYLGMQNICVPTQSKKKKDI